MGKRSLRGVLIFVPLLFLIVIIGLFIFRYIERCAQINFSQEVVTEALQHIRDLKQIGFLEQDEAVRVLRFRAKNSQQSVDELKKSWFLFTKNRTLKSIDTNKLARLIQLNKKMIRSYAQDINEYQKLGIPENNKVVLFAKDHIVRLAMAMSDLKKQQEAIKKGEEISTTQVQRIRRMIDINKQSMEYYKTELSDYSQHGFTPQEPKVQLAKRQLTQKARAINALEKLLE